MHHRAIFPVTALLLSLVSAQATTDQIVAISSCVDASGYSECMATSVSNEQACLEDAKSQNDRDVCGCVGSIVRLNCFGSSCWNKIYSCEYQALVIDYFTCVLAAEPIPFWPSPVNAPGGCSCNTGLVGKAILGGVNRSITCVQSGPSGQSLSDLDSLVAGCGCCTESVTYSAYANICPESNSTLIGFESYTTQFSSSYPWDSCSSSLNKYDCVKDLGYAAPPSGSLYNPSNLPVAGTKTLSNIPGEVTSPVSGAIYSWSAAGSVWTVTVAAQKKSATTTGSSGTKSASPVASGTGSASSSANPSSGAMAVAITSEVLAGGLAIVMGFLI